jgi:origin recognition complex subunit 3
MAQMPDTCALFQRSLDAGRLLNIADWFGAFVSIMQHEDVVRTSTQAELSQTSRGAGRSRRATSSVHVGSDIDAEGEVDEALEVQREYQARFLQSIHELEFLGLIQATGRRKEHVMRTVFETGD